MNREYDVAVIGAGIVGLAHAWMAAQRGLRVVVLERSRVAQGASVRNFGMIWPIGQPAGELYALALRSREYWMQLEALGVVDAAPCGSVHLAHRPDELAVLEEFCSQGMHEARLLSAAEVRKRAPLANPRGLLGGLWSPTELRVDPRVACSRIAGFLADRYAVECCFTTLVTRVEDHHVTSADGRRWRAARILICSGSDLQTLRGEVFDSSGLLLCKLQMLRTAPQPETDGRSVHIASGLTLRHYQAFRDCPSLAPLRQRVAAETPELDRYGIHVMASPRPAGDVILGDSHEYGNDITPFDNAQVEALMLRELHKVICLEDWTIQERWHGTYAKHPTRPIFESSCADGVEICVGAGGAGMTMAFGLADRAWQSWEGGTG